MGKGKRTAPKIVDKVLTLQLTRIPFHNTVIGGHFWVTDGTYRYCIGPKFTLEAIGAMFDVVQAGALPPEPPPDQPSEETGRQFHEALRRLYDIQKEC